MTMMTIRPGLDGATQTAQVTEDDEDDIPRGRVIKI